MRGSELPQPLLSENSYETPSMDARETAGTCKRPKCEHIKEPLQLPQLGKRQSLVTHRRPTPFIKNSVYKVERWRNEVMEQVSNSSFHSSQQHMYPESRRPGQSRLLQRGRNIGNGNLLQLGRTPGNETLCNIHGSNKSEDTTHPTKGTERRVIRKMNSESQLSELKMKLARDGAQRSSAFRGTKSDRFSGTF
eukprot:gene13821-4753_t